jgi:hypothetical protein
LTVRSFANRYRDVSADIRALTIESAVEWVLELPEQFLNDETLKYFGWLLNDTEGSIRVSVLKGLAKLYHNEDWHGHLQKFTKRYLNRIVELTSDVTVDASVESIKLLTSLLRNNVLTESAADIKHIEKISDLVFDKDPSIRQQAAIFVYHRLTKKAAASSSTPRRSKKSKKKQDIKLQDLLALMREPSEDMAMAPTYIVEGFWEHTEALKDWETMTDLILTGDEAVDEDEDEDEEKQRLESEEDVLNLIRMLTASVQLATTKESKKRKDKNEEERAKLIENMSSHMAAVLPQMFAKFQAEREKIVELIPIAKYIDLNVYTEHRLQHVSYNTNILTFSELWRVIEAAQGNSLEAY